MNNPIKNIDPDGKCIPCIPWIIEAVDAGAAYFLGGAVVKTAAYTAAPFTDGATLAVIPAAEVVDKVGAGGQVLLDLHDGKYTDAAVNLGTNQAFGAVGEKIDNAQDISKTGKAILNAINDTWSKLTDFIYDKVKDKNEEKKK